MDQANSAIPTAGTDDRAKERKELAALEGHNVDIRPDGRSPGAEKETAVGQGSEAHNESRRREGTPPPTNTGGSEKITDEEAGQMNHTNGKSEEQGQKEGAEAVDPNIVGWDGPND